MEEKGSNDGRGEVKEEGKERREEDMLRKRDGRTEGAGER